MLVTLSVFLVVGIVTVSEPASAKTRPHAIRSTQQVLVQPFGATGHISTPYTVVGRGVASCWTNSNVSGRADAWRCMAHNLIYDPCFQAPNHHFRVACPVGTLSPYQVKVFRTSQSLPFQQASTPTPAWAFQVVNGPYCIRASGAIYDWHGHGQTYVCNRKNLSGWDFPRKTSEPWTILMGRGDHPKFRRRKLRVAYS